MEAIVKYSGLILIFLILSGSAVVAETVYVNGAMKVTMRTGAGVEHKIIAMVRTGERLDMMEKKDDWSRVRTPKGKEGWILTRFITAETPLSLVVDELQKINQELSEKLSKERAENASLSDRLKKQNTTLSETETKLNSVDKSYKALKQESAGFLALKKKHKEMNSQFKEQNQRVAALEKSLGKEDIKWFLSGAGVLVAGILLGLSARKKRKSSLM